MLTVKLLRTEFLTERTFGKFTITNENGVLLFECDTVEDVVRGDGNPATVSQWKVWGKSAIPYGYYDLAFTHSPKYERNVWEIQNVPGYKGIRIHPGNTEHDTAGCILLGAKYGSAGISNSKSVTKNFEKVMEDNYTGLARIEITKETQK